MHQNGPSADSRMITRLFFRLLPTQILLAIVGAINGIVSGLFASNCIGDEAMTAIGLFSPVPQFLGAVSLMLVGGSQLLCGKQMGRNQYDETQNIFSLDIALSAGIGLLVTAAVLAWPISGLSLRLVSTRMESDALNAYCFGQALGVLPFLLSQQLAAFLSLENKMRLTQTATVVFIVANILFNLLFVRILDLGPFGLALAYSLGMWVFFSIQARYFLSGKSMFRFQFRNIRWKETLSIVVVGFPGAVSQGYQTLRKIIVNHLILQNIGSIGISAFTVSDTLLGIVWAIPTGMLTVSRMLMSISIGEEDRQSLEDIMRVMFYRCLPLMGCVSALVILSAPLLTGLYVQDSSLPVYQLAVQGFRILPLCMPLSIIMMHFVCYGQASGKQFLVHLLSALDGVICVAGFSALLVPAVGLKGVFIANVLNGIVTTVVIWTYAWISNRRFPRTVGELMVIPPDFGVPPEERMDLTLQNMEEVVHVSDSVMEFCQSKGIDGKRAYLAGLFLEEMAGNVIDHGFRKDRKPHTVDIRVVHRKDDLILRIKDDCIPFNPAERRQVTSPDDPAKNIGIRMIYSMTDRISYQSILGLNVLTVQI